MNRLMCVEASGLKPIEFFNRFGRLIATVPRRKCKMWQLRSDKALMNRIKAKNFPDAVEARIGLRRWKWNSVVRLWDIA